MVVGLIGAGNMAAALARGWAAGDGGPERLLLTDAGSGNAARLAAELPPGIGAEALGSNAELVRQADLVVLCVKPHQLEHVGAEVQDALRPGVPLASVLISTSLADLRAAFPGRAVVRLAPNTPAAVRRAVTLHAADPEADPAAERAVLSLFAALGAVVTVEEPLFLAAGALTGCGPAFLALVVEALIDAGVREGLPAAVVTELVVETMAGTATLLRAHEGDAVGVRRAVTSPGGTTERGLAELERHGVRIAFQEAVAAATLHGGRA